MHWAATHAIRVREVYAIADEPDENAMVRPESGVNPEDDGVNPPSGIGPARQIETKKPVRRAPRLHRRAGPALGKLEVALLPEREIRIVEVPDHPRAIDV